MKTTPDPSAVCPICGSNDLEKANEMMETMQAVRENGGDWMSVAREVSKLRAPHMNGECRK